MNSIPTDVPPPGFWAALRANLFAGLRVLLFRRVQPTDFVSRFDQIVGLLAVVVLTAVAADWLSAGAEDTQLVLANLKTWLALLLIGYWVCALVARAAGAGGETTSLLVAVLATAPSVLIVLWAFSLVPLLADDDSVLFGPILVVIVTWAALRATRAVYGVVRPSVLAIVLVSVLGATLADSALLFDVHLWEMPAAPDSAGTTQDWQDTESAFFDQRAVIDQELRRLQPQRPGTTDLYFVGFAGDGDEGVFHRESLFAQRIFAARMGTGSRALQLINDRADRETYPFASVVGLRYALSRIGMAMDPNDDVLVLFLTSHGSREGGIFIRNGVTPVDADLPPTELRSALDDAGIRWRIVVVSACYSGVFVEPLKSDTTAIITAADSQHTSFGCADDRDLTYFGEAFLQDSLPKARSLNEAFDLTRKEIAEREKQEKLEPSNPQMWVGASMAKKLTALGELPLPGPVALRMHE